MRLFPASLRGQTLLAVAVALLVTQAVAVILLLRAEESRRDGDLVNRAAISLLVDGEGDRRRGGRFGRGRDGEGFGRAMRLETASAFAPVAGESRNIALEALLRQTLERQGVEPARIVVVERKAGSDPVLAAAAGRGARFARRPGWREADLLVAAMQAETGGNWRIARVASPPREPARLGGVIAQTALLFLVLMAVLFLLLRRITRPLSTLTARTERFAATQEASEPLPAEGPDDVRRLIDAHNAMEARIASLLDEKDVMLGAIGHDLKTPLAALRVRIEGVEDSAARAKMAAGIEDITRSLDDILSLARIGRASEPPVTTRLDTLAATVVEEFEDMDQPATIGAMQAVTAPVHETWLRRALRNLVSNAVRYGKEAVVSVVADGGEIVFRVEDSGPGIDPARIPEMLEPFRRGEASRNRATGGSGLGLTIARAVAEQHGGRLVLAARPGGGFVAEIRLPRPPTDQP